MLDRPHNQAAGLMEMAYAQPARLVAMVSHGDEKAELPLLWRLCSHYVTLGYSVTVLDGTMMESQDNPGLEQMLDFSYWPESASDAPVWNVLPSRIGLQTIGTLAHAGRSGGFNLGHVFDNESIVLVYAGVDSLAALVAGSHVRPLIALSGAKASLMTSYMALKRLLLRARVSPTIVEVVEDNGLSNTPLGSKAAMSLSDCAKYFLDTEVSVVPIAVPIGEDQPSASIERLALALLDGAIALEAQWPGMQSMPTQRQLGQPAGKH